MTAATRIDREAAVALMAWCGWNNCGSWDNKRLAEKLRSVKDVMPEDENPEDDEVAATLIDVLATIEDGNEFEVYGETETETTEETEAAEEEAVQTETAEETEAQPVAKPKKRRGRPKKSEAEKAESKDESEKPKPEKKERTGPVGVRPVASRPYYAAQIIKKHGLEAGVTKELAAEVDALHEKSNLKESKAWMAIAWHVLNGYLEQYPVE